jgi:glycosyltransferase involved in cell wall biosynthesis
MNDRISVIVTIYNLEKYIGECIESILNQTYTNFELLLVNDGSTDNSLQICENFKNIDNRIKIINKENGGGNDARNAGLKVAKGSYISIIDGDDTIEHDMLEKLYTAAYKYKSAITTFNKYNKSVKFYKNNIIKYYFLQGDVSVCTKLYDKIFLENYLFPTTGLNMKYIPSSYKFLGGEDILASYQLFNKCNSYLIIPGDFYNCRIRADSYSRSAFKEKDTIQLLETIEVANLVKKSTPKYYKYAILHYYKATFDIISKVAIYGYNSFEEEQIFLKNLSKYRKTLRYNCMKIFASSYFSFTDKIQILLVCTSVKLFFFAKKKYISFNKLRKNN